mmetsp:Transcript_39222/g.91631  ORF Transcript_39222/g.91631 Transcript_39222/m.91631 type:complete len:318 (+) Transcript_39222:110-1063(+)
MTEEEQEKKGVPMIVTVARWTQTNFPRKAKSSNKVQMISIAYSRYCEFARFALIAAKVDFDELACIPGQHVLPALALRFSGDKPSVSTSKGMHKVGKEGEAQAKAERAARTTATPVAVAPDGTIYVDSWAIANSTGLAPCDDGLRKTLDEEVAVDARHAVYFYLLQEKNIPLFHQMGALGESWGWRALWNLGMNHKLTGMLGEAFKVDDVAAKDAAISRLKDQFKRIDELYMSKKKGIYLSGGDAPGLGDIALAAIAGPMCTPDKILGGKYKPIFDKLLDANEELRENVAYFRQTAVGAHCMMIYDKHRPLAEGVKL